MNFVAASWDRFGLLSGTGGWGFKFGVPFIIGNICRRVLDMFEMCNKAMCAMRAASSRFAQLVFQSFAVQLLAAHNNNHGDYFQLMRIIFCRLLLVARVRVSGSRAGSGQWPRLVMRIPRRFAWTQYWDSNLEFPIIVSERLEKRIPDNRII